MKLSLPHSIGKKIYTITGIAIICFSIQFVVSVMCMRLSDRVSALLKIGYEHTEVRRNIAESFYRYLSAEKNKDFTELFDNLLVSIEQMSTLGAIVEDAGKGSAEDMTTKVEYAFTSISRLEAGNIVWATNFLSSKTIGNRLIEIKKACEQIDERCFSLGGKESGNLDKTDLEIFRSDLTNIVEDSERLAGELSLIIEKISHRGTLIATRGMTIIFILLLAISASLAWLLTRSITNPLRTLVDFAGAIAGGDLTRKLEIKHKDEIGILSQAMSEMRKNLAADIARRQQAEEELKSFLEFNKTILSFSPYGVFTYDSTGQCTSVNEAGAHLVGSTREENLAQNYHNIESWKKSGLLEKAKKALSTNETQLLDVKVITTFGKEVSVDSRLVPFHFAGEKHLMLMINDVSEQKAIENQLRHARDEAETANLAKSEFLANMSHEIRTPMNGILGFADLLIEDELTVEQREAVETIKKSGQDLLSIINDILDLSKVESSKIELETIPFDVEDIVLEVGELVRTNLGEKFVEINCEIGDIQTNLVGDPTRLRQIITNLTGNAVKFTEEGEIVISVTMEKEGDEEITLKFSVRDTGIGIPADKLDTVFESFKQVDGSTTRKYGGTGLGLTISRKLAQLMGGDMWVESPAGNGEFKGGRGSIFYFTARFKENSEPSEKCSPAGVSELQGKHILIVDDNETALKILENMVKRVGMIPMTARNGEEALAHLESSIINREWSIDIVITDLLMPGMSGYELAAGIYDLTHGKTKIIAVSSSGGLGPVTEKKKSHFTCFLSKPVRGNILINRIREALGLGEKIKISEESKLKVREPIIHDVSILYAEDNPVNQMLGLKVMERMGYKKVEIAPDGLEALKRVKDNGKYDIIFMDIQMPNMNGIEAAKEIRKWEEMLKVGNSKLKAQPGGIPIVALTANAMKGDREKYLEAGMDDYLSKPFKREDIQRVITEQVHKVETGVEVREDARILIVEDEENMRKSVIRLLRREMPAAKVMSAENGIDASAKLGSFAPDLILTDIMMPKMDGAEFIRYVRGSERYANTRIVAVTALYEDDPRVVAVKELGVERILSKPWENTELISAIKDSLGMRCKV